MSIFLSYILVFHVFAQGPSEAEFVVDTVPQPKASFVTLLDSQAYFCEQGDVEKKCERNLVYEKDSESIYQMIADGRVDALENGKFDINEVLRRPASYSGHINTISLSSVFPDKSQFDSVIARYTKDNKIIIEVVVANKKYNDTIEVPNPY